MPLVRIFILLGGAVLFLAALSLAVAFLSGRFSDGPLGPLPGGPLRRGELIREPQIDWTFAEDVQLAQLQLESPPHSRTTGILVHEGKLFIPCDLGFVWRRVQPPAKWMMALVWKVKRWHEDVLRDGRVVIRIRGKRYVRQAVLVEEPTLRDALMKKVEFGAESFLSAPLAKEPADRQAILFFRLNPRP